MDTIKCANKTEYEHLRRTLIREGYTVTKVAELTIGVLEGLRRDEVHSASVPKDGN